MELLFREKVSQEFADKVITVSNNLGIDPNWLMAIINFESAGTFSSSIKNKYGYVGLIQFGKVAAERMGTTTTELQQMSAVEQLDYVYKYYYPYRKRLKSYVDMYLATLFPVAIGKPLDFVLQTTYLPAWKIAKANPIFDYNDDKMITVAEIRQKMLSYIPKSWRDYFSDGTTSINKNDKTELKKNATSNCGCGYFGSCNCHC